MDLGLGVVDGGVDEGAQGVGESWEDVSKQTLNRALEEVSEGGDCVADKFTGGVDDGVGEGFHAIDDGVDR